MLSNALLSQLNQQSRYPLDCHRRSSYGFRLFRCSRCYRIGVSRRDWTNRGRNRIDAERSRCIDAANPMLARTGTNGIDASNALFDGVVQEADYSTIFSNSAIKLMLSKKKEGSDSFPQKRLSHAKWRICCSRGRINSSASHAHEEDSSFYSISDLSAFDFSSKMPIITSFGRNGIEKVQISCFFFFCQKVLDMQHPPVMADSTNPRCLKEGIWLS